MSFPDQESKANICKITKSETEYLIKPPLMQNILIFCNIDSQMTVINIKCINMPSTDSCKLLLGTFWRDRKNNVNSFKSEKTKLNCQNKGPSWYEIASWKWVVQPILLKALWQRESTETHPKYLYLSTYHITAQ